MVTVKSGRTVPAEVSWLRPAVGCHLHDMALDPRRELVSTHLTGCDRKNDSFLLIDRCLELVPIQNQEDLERRVAHALVAVDERMIRDQ